MIRLPMCNSCYYRELCKYRITKKERGTRIYLTTLLNNNAEEICNPGVLDVIVRCNAYREEEDKEEVEETCL